MQIELQRSLGLRAEEQQVFLAIAVDTVQRFARTAAPGADHMSRAPLPRELAGHIFRRRIAEALGLPFETVRRHVARMKKRGLLVEGKKGQLSPRAARSRGWGRMTSPSISRGGSHLSCACCSAWARYRTRSFSVAAPVPACEFAYRRLRDRRVALPAVRQQRDQRTVRHERDAEPCGRIENIVLAWRGRSGHGLPSFCRPDAG